MLLRVRILLIVLMLIPPALLHAGVIEVPGDQPTIQAGIDAATGGDTVQVASGIYTGAGNRDLDFKGKAIIVKSENGPKKCIIDCQGSFAEPHRGFIFHSGEGESSVLQGFTIKNGRVGTSGGGISCQNGASPTITGNIITNNIASLYGGGIFCSDYSTAAIVGNTISGNSLNGIMSHGGGIFCGYSASPTIDNNSITENAAVSNGGGIFCDDVCTAEIINNIITGNTAELGGGAISCTGASPDVTNNLIAENAALYYGGGIYARYSSSLALMNNTIAGNLVTYDGGGICCDNASTMTIVNTILWDNTAQTGKEIYIGTGAAPSTITISYSDMKDGPSSVYVESGCTLNRGAGMIEGDPLFVTGPRGDHYLFQVAAGRPGDRLSPRWTADSPCVDAGDREIGLLPETFRMGTTRTDWVRDAGVIDMGYHYAERRVAVGPNQVQK